MFTKKLTTEERITKAKIALQNEQPFWAYLVLKMTVSEDVNNQIPPWGGAGINAKGQMLWKREFMEKLSDSEIKFVLAHEVGHLIFGHLFRVGSRNKMLFNIASDCVMNNILRMNNFSVLSDSIVPSWDHKITLFGKQIINIDKKTAEQVYDEMPKPTEKKIEANAGFDSHEYGEELTETEKQEQEQKWKENLIGAAVHAKQKGSLPRGMEEILDMVMHPKFNWKQLLRKYMTNMLPYDYTFSRPNRKIPNFILPGVVKETIEMVVHVDTSGSISTQELNEFMSEIIGMATAHQNLNMTLIECDADIQQVIEVNSRNISKLRNLTIKGRGGTSHRPIWNWIKKNKPQSKLFVSLTDLYSDVELSDKPRGDVLWVVPVNGTDKVPFGKVLKMR
jgi:predicted metal-dependent peptidase